MKNPERQTEPFHIHDEIRFQVIPVSPSNTYTELQVVCFFDQTLNQNYAGGTAAVDEHFKGEIKKLRAEDLFRGERFETLILTPEASQIPATKLLMIGLGDPSTISLEVLSTVGRIAVREALNLGVSEFCFAPSLKDADIGHLPANEVSADLVHGMLKAIAAARILSSRALVQEVSLKEIIFLAGAAHVKNAQSGLKKVLEDNHD